jgi:hypothetical protein
MAMQQAENIVRRFLRIFATAFPDRLLSAYIEGSYADATSLATSDLDMTIIFRDTWLPGERARAEQIGDAQAQQSTVELDIVLMDEAETKRGVRPHLKLGSTLGWGHDLRDDMPLLPIEEWTRDRMHSSLWRSATLFGRPGVVTLPLTYPDPTAEFYGYTARTVRLADGRELPSTRDLIRLVGWAATALLAFYKGIYVARKRDCHRLYREHLGDEWTELMEGIYDRCRGDWDYLIPEDPMDRAALQAICERTLAFENHFLGIYREYLLGELADPAAAHLSRLLGTLERVGFRDAAVMAALQRLRERGEGEIREEAGRALHCIAF